MHSVLLDTGPLVSLIEPKEKYHQACTEFIKNFRGFLVTTEAVLVEALYLLRASIKAQCLCIGLIQSAEVELAPSNFQRLNRAMELMRIYRNVPMDFADATLVRLGEEYQIDEIFTLDRRGFETYRLPRKKTFKIFPAKY